MNFMAYGVSLAIFLAVDLIWLGAVARRFYAGQLAALRGPVKWPVAAVFYLLFNAGLMLFAIQPALDAGDFNIALNRGAMFGFFTYMTYDLTNLATLKDWPVRLTLVDILWGTSLCAVAAGGAAVVLL
jgi:uncharacterized membrane protein